MTGCQFAWVTHAPADYMLVFTEDPEGDHAVVCARFEHENELSDAGRGLEGTEVADNELRVYCTLPGEAEVVLAEVRKAAASAWIDRGTVAFVAVGDGSGTSNEGASGRRKVTARIVLSGGGQAPRRYAF